MLDRSPNRFHSVTIHEASNGWSYYFGSVSTEEDRDFLLSESERIFGESLGRKMVRAVLIDEMK